MNKKIEMFVSPSRTYVAAIFDLMMPNQCRFSKFALPEKYENHIKTAESYYMHQINSAGPLMGCITFEEYMQTVEEALFTEEPSKKDLKSYNGFASALPTDMEEVSQMLEAYNDEQPIGETDSSYSGILRRILKTVEHQKNLLDEIEKMIHGPKGEKHHG